LVFFHHRCGFIAREIRNLIERRRKRLISLSYPGRIVRVPRGWSVLEASRSFHLPHAAMCGGRSAMLDLPGAGDRRRGVLSAAGQRRAADAWSASARRRACGWRASCVRRANFGYAPGANGAAGLPGGGPATQPRA
jgi:hypothetical protein